jgi:hypothetical protein
MTNETRSNSKTLCKLSFRCRLLPRNRHRLSFAIGARYTLDVVPAKAGTHNH